MSEELDLKEVSKICTRANQLLDLGKYKMAIDHFDSIKGKLAHLDIWFVYSGLGLAYERLNDIPKAEEVANQFVQAYPEEAGGYYSKARLGHITRRPKQMKENIEAALRIEPDNAHYLVVLAEYYLFKRRFPKAKEILDKVAETDPQNFGYYFARCKYYLGKRQFDKFDEFIKEALSLFPNNSDLLFLKSNRFLQTNQFETAKSTARHSLALDPEHKNSRKAYEDAESGLNSAVPIGIMFFILIKIAYFISRLMIGSS